MIELYGGMSLMMIDDMAEMSLSKADVYEAYCSTTIPTLVPCSVHFVFLENHLQSVGPFCQSLFRTRRVIESHAFSDRHANQSTRHCPIELVDSIFRRPVD